MNLRPVVRAAAPLAVAATLSVLLAACGSSAKPASTAKSPSASPTASTGAVDCTTLKPGSVSDSVVVSGTFGKTPSIKLNGTVTATNIQKSVVIKGSGAVPALGDTVNAHLSLFTGAGKKLGDQDAQVPLGNTLRPVFADALSCNGYGTRSVITVPASQVYDAGSLPTGVKSTDTLIIVSDLVSKFAPTAWTTQVPTVTFAASGKPTVKLVGKPMAAWALKVLRPGTGDVVKAGDNVTVEYQGTSWNTGKIFDQSYGRAPATFNTTQVVTGFGGALVGQKVGTRLVVTIPPQYGYGTNKAQGGLAGQTLVFVIEIQKTSHS